MSVLPTEPLQIAEPFRGRNDMRRTLRHRKWRQRTKPTMGVHILDLAD